MFITMITVNLFQAPAGRAKHVVQVAWTPPETASVSAAATALNESDKKIIRTKGKVPFDNTIENIVSLAPLLQWVLESVTLRFTKNLLKPISHYAMLLSVLL